jgi:hypothetical protein
VPSCSVFTVLYVRRPLRKLATNIFDLSDLILGLCLNVYLSSQKVRAAFFCIRGKVCSVYVVTVYSVYVVTVCSLLYILLYRFS